MSNKLSNEKLAELLALCEKATPGLWRHETSPQRGHTVWASLDRVGSMQVATTGHAATFDRDNAAYIAAFDPSTCAELVKEVVRLRKRNKSMADELGHQDSYFDDPLRGNLKC